MQKKSLRKVYDKKSEDFKKIIQLLEEEPMKFKFGAVALPCNEIEDFETLGVGMDIPCRIYLAKAPSCKHEKIAKNWMENFILRITSLLSVLPEK